VHCRGSWNIPRTRMEIKSDMCSFKLLSAAYLPASAPLLSQGNMSMQGALGVPSCLVHCSSRGWAGTTAKWGGWVIMVHACAEGSALEVPSDRGLLLGCCFQQLLQARQCQLLPLSSLSKYPSHPGCMHACSRGKRRVVVCRCSGCVPACWVDCKSGTAAPHCSVQLSCRMLGSLGAGFNVCIRSLLTGGGEGGGRCSAYEAE
jgi:hypothetical protein